MATNMEAWSTGAVRIEVDEGHLPIVASVELLHVHQLVHVIARADSDDPAFAGCLPAVMTAVEWFPKVSLARDPLAELGQRVRGAFFEGVREQAQKHLAESKSKTVAS